MPEKVSITLIRQRDDDIRLILKIDKYGENDTKYIQSYDINDGLLKAISFLTRIMD